VVVLGFCCCVNLWGARSFSLGVLRAYWMEGGGMVHWLLHSFSSSFLPIIGVSLKTSQFRIVIWFVLRAFAG